MLPVIARNQAAAVGLEIAAEDIALALLHLRVLRGEIDFIELRAWFTSQMRPAEP